jgi:hypothetical protein
MPVRFQVDPDFYDHPKTAGMSDAAFSLWVRAGSYSVAKLTDGFTRETVLVHTLRSDTSVADELVERGLWRRCRGDYVFHEWSVRNLTRQRIEEHNQADAERKRKERLNKKTAGQSPKRPPGRAPDDDRTSGGSPPYVGVVSSSGSVEQKPLVDDGYISVTRECAPAREARGTRIPADFAINADMVAWAREHTPHVDARRETERFIDHWRAATGKNSTKCDWIAAWRNWMRRAGDELPSRHGHRPTSSGIDTAVAGWEALRHNPFPPQVLPRGQS